MPTLRCLIRRWRALEPWIIAGAVEDRYSRFPPTALRELTTRRREAVTVEGEFGDWTPITVHLNGAISTRDRIRPYKGGMFAAYPGDIVFSKIDARSGAIGMLPPEIGKAVVTAEFPIFTGDPARLEGEFVKMVLRTGGFMEALRRRASGTSGRKRITPEAFEELCIPLPPLDEQRAIVFAHRVALDRATHLESEAHQSEARAIEAFEGSTWFRVCRAASRSADRRCIFQGPRPLEPRGDPSPDRRRRRGPQIALSDCPTRRRHRRSGKRMEPEVP